MPVATFLDTARKIVADERGDDLEIRIWDGKSLDDTHTALSAFAAEHGLNQGAQKALQILVEAGETFRWLDANDVDWRVNRALPVVEAFAEHCFGGSSCNEPFTRIAVRKPYADGGTFIANVFSVHLPEGHVFLDGGTRYRLRLAERRAAA